MQLSTAKTAFRRIALIGFAIIVIWGLGTVIFDPRAIGDALIMTLFMTYLIATILACTAIERPDLDQRLRYPGAVLNVIAAVFPIAILARWINGDLPLQGFAPIIPVVGFSALVAALLWVVEVDKVFRPTRRLVIIVGIVTFLVAAIVTFEPQQAGQNYADYLRGLDRLAKVSGFLYAICGALWLYFLYFGIKQSQSKARFGQSPIERN